MLMNKPSGMNYFECHFKENIYKTIKMPGISFVGKIFHTCIQVLPENLFL